MALSKPRPVLFTMTGGSPDYRVEPLDLDVAKRNQKVQYTSEDDLFRQWIASAREYLEEQTGRQLITATYEVAVDRFPSGGVIEIPRPPLISVESVVYDDGNGIEQTLDPALYRVVPSVVLQGSPPTAVIDPYCERGYIERVSGSTWPSTVSHSQAIRIRYVCGYGSTAEDVPAKLREMMHLLVGHYHRNRSEVTGETTHALPLGAEDALLNFKATAMSTRRCA